MTKFLLTFALIASVLAFVPSTANAAQPTNSPLSIPIVGKAVPLPTNPTGAPGTFRGTFNLTGFALQNGKLMAIGTVTGIVTDTTGVATSLLQNVAMTATATAPSCPILHLVLGPLTLDLLGLQITTNQIVLDITAIPGPGNLLGNLLCDVANLLNNPTQRLVDLLNQIIGVLRGL